VKVNETSLPKQQHKHDQLKKKKIATQLHESMELNAWRRSETVCCHQKIINHAVKMVLSRSL
jgi:hypothetical protein